MPRPRKGEKRSLFIGRAIAEFRHEGFEADEAAGRAYGFWNYYKNHKAKYRRPIARRG